MVMGMTMSIITKRAAADMSMNTSITIITKNAAVKMSTTMKSAAVDMSIIITNMAGAAVVTVMISVCAGRKAELTKTIRKS